MSNPAVVLREATPADMPFVLHSYLKSYREAPLNKMINTKEYYKVHGDWVNSCILEPFSRIVLAVNPESPDQIYGYVWYFDLGDRKFVNWLYIKQPFRRFGVASLLLNQFKGVAGTYYTHFNDNWALFRSYNARYLPWYYFKKDEK